MRRRVRQYSCHARRKLHGDGHGHERIVPGLDHGDAGGDEVKTTLTLASQRTGLGRFESSDNGSTNHASTNKTRTNSMRKLIPTKAVALLVLALGCTAMVPRPAAAQNGSLVEIGR